MRVALWTVVAVTCSSAGTARADDASPWAVGVSDAQKAEAQALLEAGNARFLDKQFVEALAQYTAAVAVWDHPAIRFNMVRCEIQLGRNLDASTDLARALVYGKAPLEGDTYDEALGYQKLLDSQIGELTYECSQPGVSLTLDGKPLATCPAQHHLRLASGPHQVVAKGPGLVTETQELVVVGSQSVRAKLVLVPFSPRLEHRWRASVPWTVVASGFALAGIGGALELVAFDRMKTYDKFVDVTCTHNCTVDDLADVAHLKTGAQRESAVGLGFLVGGAAAVAVGVTMLYLNRGREIHPEVAPLDGGAALSVKGAF